jgi:type VI protein secretion system component VasA
MQNELSGYYEEEWIFLRQMDADFTKKYQKIAAH